MASNISLHDGTAKARARWLNGWRGTGRGPFLLAVLAGTLGGLALIAQCWLVARVIEAVVIERAGLADVWPLLWMLLAVAVARAGLDTLRQGWAFEGAARVKRRLRAALIHRLTALGPGWMEGQRSGAIASTLSDGVEAVESYFAAYLPQKLIGAFVPVAILVAVLPADWISGVILLVTAPVIPIFMIVVGKGAEALNQRQWRRLHLLGAHVFDAIEGLTTLKQFGASAREARTVAAMSEGYRTATMAVLRVAFLSSLVLEFFATIAVAMVAVYVGFRLYYGQLDFLPGLFALLLAPEFYRPLREMGQHYHARMDAIGAAEGLMAVLEAPLPPAQEGGDLPPGPRTVEARGLTFRHAEGGGVEGVDLALNPGTCVALVGPSGAGKTTLAKLILGLVAPQEGRILVGGRDLSDVAPDRWRARVGWMPQRATLFAGSIRDNICLARPDATAREVMRAAADARAAQFIEDLPRGYDTLLGDGGQGLSGGQIQRVAMARALLTGPDVLILDEPTAALDRRTAADMLATIRMVRPQVAILLITHDLPTARAADRVLMMEHGRIVEAGTPAELAAGDGAFARLARLAEDMQ